MGSKSRRLRALEGICRTMSDLLDERVERAAKARGLQEPPQDTTRIFQIASERASPAFNQASCASPRSVFRLSGRSERSLRLR